MKDTIKKLLKKMFNVCPGLRIIVKKLNNVAMDTMYGIKITPEERNMFTPKALYSGYSVEYLNAVSCKMKLHN